MFSDLDVVFMPLWVTQQYILQKKDPTKLSDQVIVTFQERATEIFQKRKSYRSVDLTHKTTDWEQ